MEELSIEEKAKRYDEAMKAAVVAHKDEDRHLKATLERIFPELKESEDEKISKEIQDFISWAINMGCIKKEQREKTVSWFSWLEKQGKQKETLCDKCKKAQPSHSCQDITALGRCALEKQGEQKPQGNSALEATNEEKVDNANKVETKFKDGNVLHSPTHRLIWIYKDNEHYHACVDMNYVKDNVFAEGLIAIPEDACPATKLQRDILFSKIKEAGYEWDADKKELKKIEQNPTWSEEDERNLEGIIDEIEANKNNAPDYDLTTYDRFLSWLKFLKERYTWKPSEEQLDALQYVYRNLNPPLSDKLWWDSTKTLELLYQDLKKLK